MEKIEKCKNVEGVEKENQQFKDFALGYLMGLVSRPAISELLTKSDVEMIDTFKAQYINNPINIVVPHGTDFFK